MFIFYRYVQDLNTIVKIFWWLNFIFVTIFFFVYIFQHIHAVITLFTKKKIWPPASIKHKYGILIAGRNESKVIGNLIQSIYKSNYPKELITVFVCADNCTDNTAIVARNNGAIVYERFDLNNIGKSYALDFLIKKILSNKSYNDIECFFVMDADNLVSKNYISEMNKTFDTGIEVATSFRESKNFEANWVSACSALTFYRECCIIHHSRQRLGVGTYVSGTGYFVSRRIIEMLNGWHFNTMTEDIEFSIWCATHQILVSFNEDAVFYDEQPESIRVANRQRLRWCKGTHQCCKKYDVKLLEKMARKKKKLALFELFTHVTPFPIITVTWFFIYLFSNLIFLYMGLETNRYFINEVTSNVIGFLFFLVFVSQLQALICIVKNRKRMRKYSLWSKIKSVLLFPLFVSMYIPLSFQALLKKNITWKQIPHTNTTTIESIEEKENINK